MKYVIIHGDGMADWACDELEGRTPLEAARKPNMDMLATRGTLGMVATIPDGMPSGSDVGFRGKQAQFTRGNCKLRGPTIQAD